MLVSLVGAAEMAQRDTREVEIKKEREKEREREREREREGLALGLSKFILFYLLPWNSQVHTRAKASDI